jgi:hypothetical protein
MANKIDLSSVPDSTVGPIVQLLARYIPRVSVTKTANGWVCVESCLRSTGDSLSAVEITVLCCLQCMLAIDYISVFFQTETLRVCFDLIHNLFKKIQETSIDSVSSFVHKLLGDNFAAFTWRNRLLESLQVWAELMFEGTSGVVRVVRRALNLSIHGTRLTANTLHFPSMMLFCDGLYRVLCCIEPCIEIASSCFENL